MTDCLRPTFQGAEAFVMLSKWRADRLVRTIRQHRLTLPRRIDGVRVYRLGHLRSLFGALRVAAATFGSKLFVTVAVAARYVRLRFCTP